MIQKLLIVVFTAFFGQGLTLPATSKTVYEMRLPDIFSYSAHINAKDPYYNRDCTRYYGILNDVNRPQVSCQVTFPNGILYNLWPNFNVTEPNVKAHNQNGCYIGFFQPLPSLSGTYEVLFLVNSTNNSQILYRRRYHMTFEWVEIDTDVKADDGVNKEIVVDDLK